VRRRSRSSYSALIGALWVSRVARQQAEHDGQQLIVVSPSQQAVPIARKQTPSDVGLDGNVFAELLDD
jgi:hypothetical protein